MYKTLFDKNIELQPSNVTKTLQQLNHIKYK